MVLFKVSHPPAGATTLIISLSIIALPKDLIVIEAAVVIFTFQVFVFNRLAGMRYPLWHEHSASVDVLYCQVQQRAKPGHSSQLSLAGTISKRAAITSTENDLPQLQS